MWDARRVEKDTSARITSCFNNLLIGNFDYVTGEIPPWLPGEMHNNYARIIAEGRKPTLSRNAQGFYFKCLDAPNEEQRAEAAPLKRKFELLPFAAMRPGAEQPYLIDELIPKEGIVVIWGKPKCLKSFVTLDMMLHVAMGWEYRDRAVRQGTVVYCAFEGAHGYRKRVEGLRRHYNLSDKAEVPLFIVSAQTNLVKHHETLKADITDQLNGKSPAAVVLDTLNKSMSGSENDPKDMGQYLKAAEAIRDAFACAVIIVHHCGYDDSRPRGHSSLPAALDAQLATVRSGNLVTVRVEFMRDGPEDIAISSEVEVIDVGTDQKGKALTKLVVNPSDVPAESAKNDKTRGRSVFLAAMRNLLPIHGEEFQPAEGEFPLRGLNLVLVRRRFETTYVEIDRDDDTPERRTDRTRKAYKRALDDLIAKGVVEVATINNKVMVWVK